MSNNFPEGIDCAWIASDRDGYVGAFITGGAGAIPSAALNSGHVSLSDIEIEMNRLPVVGVARMLVTVPRPDDFISLAKRGFYVFDWQADYTAGDQKAGFYSAVALPDNPIRTEDLGAALEGVAREVSLRDFVFADDRIVAVRD
jgi:hypothetical protein